MADPPISAGKPWIERGHARGRYWTRAVTSCLPILDQVDGFLISRQVPIDPASGEIIGTAPAEQGAQCLRNLTDLCEATGARIANAARLTIYTSRPDCFVDLSELCVQFFADADPPTRTVVVTSLPKDVLVEIDAVVPVSAEAVVSR